MPRQILPHLVDLSNQIQGIIRHYTRMLDDEFLFGSGAQMPQVATIFDRVAQRPLHFKGEDLTLTELLTLIAYRYGFQSVRVIGHGGYAIVVGHRDHNLPEGVTQRRVLRLVPEHHVRDIIARSDTANEFDVRLKDDRDPLRDVDYPLLLSDLFLMPRHTTRLVFRGADGQILQAGGYPAILHCQLLPEVRAFNQFAADTTSAKAAGDLLEAALATLGVSVADAHGGNGGVLIGGDGQPIQYHIIGQTDVSHKTYIPVVLDYGYYAAIGARTLANVLVRGGVSRQMVDDLLVSVPDFAPGEAAPLAEYFTQVIERSGLPRSRFGRLLFAAQPDLLNPRIWIDHTEEHWQTTKERTYPPLRAQSRLARLYPDYDEVIFPQRIEEYSFTI